MKSAAEILNSINAYIEGIAYERKPFSLYEPIKYVLSMGGKRVRPTLMMLAYDMYKTNPEDILPLAVGLETYHNYTLLHDDLMDNADVRRGMPTVHKKWDANTAILSGDTMLLMAYELVGRTPEKKLHDVLSLFTETAMQISEGQQMDMDFERRMDVTEEEYIEMIRLKTSVLLACALKMGALMADAPTRDADLLYRFGVAIGLAFQLQDDYLDVYGNPAVFGKAIGGDIMENKKTFMLINALLSADDEQHGELLKWIACEQPVAQEKIAAVTKLYDEIGVDKLAQSRIESYFEEAEKLLNAVSLPEEKKAVLRSYARQMMHREK